MRALARTAIRRRRRCYSTTAHVIESDVVIVGGGPVGLALASALGPSNNLSITLVEAGSLASIRDWKPTAQQYSNRVSSITNASRHLLERSGSWRFIEHRRTTPIEQMQVWDGISDARITFDAPEATPTPSMATLTENLNLQRAILHQLQGLPRVSLFDNVKVSSITRDGASRDGWPLVHLSDGRVVRARLLVGADGFNSPVRAFANIKSFGWAYDTHGVVATLHHSPRSPFEPPNTVAYQRFLPTGPIAFLPLTETTSSLVWSTKPHLAHALKRLDPAVFALFVNAAFRLPEVSIRYMHNILAESEGQLSLSETLEELVFRERSHNISEQSTLSSTNASPQVGIPPADSEMYPPLVNSVQEGSVASFPLRYNHADAYIADEGRVALIGDAAHTVHPLAGQGLNIGLGDVDALSRCISEALSSGADIGSYTALKSYAREQYSANHNLMSAIDKIHKLYSFTNDPVVWARSVGLEIVNELDSLKSAIMLDAAGASAKFTNGKPSAASWDGVAKAVESVGSGVKLAQLLGNNALGLARNALQNYLK